MHRQSPSSLFAEDDLELLIPFALTSPALEVQAHTTTASAEMEPGCTDARLLSPD